MGQYGGSAPAAEEFQPGGILLKKKGKKREKISQLRVSLLKNNVSVALYISYGILLVISNCHNKVDLFIRLWVLWEVFIFPVARSISKRANFGRAGFWRRRRVCRVFASVSRSFPVRLQKIKDPVGEHI